MAESYFHVESACKIEKNQARCGKFHFDLNLNQDCRYRLEYLSEKQYVAKVLSDTPGLVELSFELVCFYHKLPLAQASFLAFSLRKTCSRQYLRERTTG